MAEITAALVKELREKTGAGMMDCKKALVANEGSVEDAIDWLRTKGLSVAAKKAGRVAAQGLIGVATGTGVGAMIEVNSETDFVAKNERFQDFVRVAAGLSLANDGALEAVVASGYPETDRTVAEELTQMIATIGENMSARRAISVSVGSGVVGSYIHNVAAPGLGKIGVIVGLESDGDADALEELARHLAMHIAATNPQSLDIEDLDPAIIEREKAVQIEKARESGKPEEIIMKMIEGRMRKFYEEVALLHQVSVVDGERKVGKILEDSAKEMGTDIKITAFARFELGEGIEQKESDFAAEVKEAAGV